MSQHIHSLFHIIHRVIHRISPVRRCAEPFPETAIIIADSSFFGKGNAKKDHAA